MFIKTVVIFIAASTFFYPQGINDTVIVVGDTLITTDTTLVSDSSTIDDSVIHHDTVIYFPKNLYHNSFLIQRDVLLRNDYRYSGDLIEPFQFNFIKNLGTPGQPHETFIYGVGFDGISYLQDGILINDRLHNILDLNFVQSEDIEAIEITPSPRGFLYGPINNPVTVNFITRDFIPAQPYSRIKYYQGPYGEAMVDGSFNALFSRNFQFSFDVTNRKYDSSYTNTSFSAWQAKVRAKYFFNNNFYLTASYNYLTKTTGRWGGVDADSILRSDVPLENLLYETDFAPVNNRFGIQDYLLHSSSLRMTSVQSEVSRTELTLYQQFKESKLNDIYNTEFDNTTLGINLNQKFGIKPFSFSADLIYEQNKLESWYSGSNILIFFPYSKRNLNFFSFSGMVSVNLIDDLIPSVYYKFNGITSSFGESSSTDNSGSGIGADLKYNPFDNYSLYIGYSSFDKTFYADRKTNVFESGLMYKTENHFVDLKYFRRDNTNIFAITGLTFIPQYPIEIGNISGIGFSADIKYWNLQFETQTSAYFANEGDLYSLPDIRFVGGLYFRGNLFEDNLNLKAGLKFTYTGEIISVTENYGLRRVDSSNKLDFILSGEIRKAAIIYFAIENIIDKQYYITPYYPMPGISFRFGLAWEFLN